MSADRIGPIFLVGAQRSGTTALGTAIAAAVTPGGTFTVNGKLFYYLLRWWNDNPSRRHMRADEISYSLRRRMPFTPNAEAWLTLCDEALTAGARRIASCGATLDMGDEMRRICREAYGDGRFWGDKYNEYLLDLPALHTLFPDAVWIFVARDPRQVVASMLEWTPQKPWNPDTVRACAEKWRAWNQCWLDFRETLAGEHRLEYIYGRNTKAFAELLTARTGIRITDKFSDYKPRERAHANELEMPLPVADLWEVLVRSSDDGLERQPLRSEESLIEKNAAEQPKLTP